MRVDCVHGYFKFTESRAGEIADFINLFDLSLVYKDGVFIFEALEDAKEYSILGADYLGVPATKTFAGHVWEVMRENGLVYNFELDLVQPILSVTNIIEVVQSDSYYIAEGLIVPGSLTAEGQRVTDYSAWFLRDSMRFKYSGVNYDESL